jgi:large conductance mechanosensitive channel
VGVFITALLSFVLTAAVVYWLVVIPYNRLSARLKAMQEQPEAAPAVTSEDLLTEIRDLMRQQAAGNPLPGQVPDQR